MKPINCIFELASILAEDIEHSGEDVGLVEATVVPIEQTGKSRLMSQDIIEECYELQLLL
jgi:hypothetical protein